MSQDQTLSGEEISALMSEARASGSAEGGAPAMPTRAFSLGGDAGRTMAAIPALDRLNERMVKRLRDVIEPFAQPLDHALVEPVQRRDRGHCPAGIPPKRESARRRCRRATLGGPARAGLAHEG